jgi:hypothetical protein
MNVLSAAWILVAGLAAAGQRQNGNAVEYHFGDRYVVIAVTELRAFLEIRTYDQDRIIGNVVLGSRYMPPDFEAKDVVLGDDPEFIFRTRDGGTGFAETHFSIYGVLAGHLRRFGDFVVERQAESWPTSEYREDLSGKVSFPAKNKLEYRYHQIITKEGKTQTNSVIQSFLFNEKAGKYERTKRP